MSNDFGMRVTDNDRRLRVQYPGALYHLMSRGVLRSDIYLNEHDRSAFFLRCEATVNRFGWLVYSAVQMTNHFHLLFQTPEPNLCRGAQYLLGPYAQQFNRRHRRSGHVFESRYCCRVVESEEYLWSVSRYDHLNPVPTLVSHPASWTWSSYRGYCDPALRLEWVCYDGLLAAWKGAFGSAEQSYCQFVEQGLALSASVGLPNLVDGWIIGSEQFARQIRKMVSPESEEPNVLRTRLRPNLTLDEVVHAVSAEYNLRPERLSRKSSRHPARQMVALLASQYSTARLKDIASTLGLAGRDSIHKAIQRANANASNEFQVRLAAIQLSLAPNNDGPE